MCTVSFGPRSVGHLSFCTTEVKRSRALRDGFCSDMSRKAQPQTAAMLFIIGHQCKKIVSLLPGYELWSLCMTYISKRDQQRDDWLFVYCYYSIFFLSLDGFQLGKVIKRKQLSCWSAEDELRVWQSERRSYSVVWWYGTKLQFSLFYHPRVRITYLVNV